MKKLAPTVLIILSLITLVWASLRTNAAWHYFAAQSITEHIEKTGAMTSQDVTSATEHINKALSRFPINPDYLQLSARLKELQAGQTGVMGAERDELLESALADYRSALAVRPLWPYTWISILAVKGQQGQFDKEFITALNRAAETGPWEPPVQLQVVRSGLRFWDQMGASEKSLVQDMINDALRTQPREVFGIVRFFARPELICHAGKAHSQIERWCTSVGF